MDTDVGTDTERNTLVIAYVLYALGPFTGSLTAIAGVIVNHLKINDTDSEFLRSHHSWLIRTFWWGLLWGIIGTALTIIGVGLVILGVLAVWYIYRIVRGLIAYSDRKVLPS